MKSAVNMAGFFSYLSLEILKFSWETLKKISEEPKPSRSTSSKRRSNISWHRCWRCLTLRFQWPARRTLEGCFSKSRISRENGPLMAFWRIPNFSVDPAQKGGEPKLSWASLPIGNNILRHHDTDSHPQQQPLFNHYHCQVAQRT